jgi:hypothetical protein
MRKTVQGGKMGMAEHVGNGNGLCGEGGMRKTLRGGENKKDGAGRGNGNGRTRNDNLPLTALISSKDSLVDT